MHLGALRTCHDTAKHTIARSAVDAGFRVEVEVYGVFTRALREAQSIIGQRGLLCVSVLVVRWLGGMVGVVK
jgi:hypothetical protein